MKDLMKYIVNVVFYALALAALAWTASLTVSLGKLR